MNYETFSLTRRSREANFTQESSLKRPNVTHLKKRCLQKWPWRKGRYYFSVVTNTQKKFRHILGLFKQIVFTTLRTVKCWQSKKKKRNVLLTIVTYFAEVLCKVILVETFRGILFSLENVLYEKGQCQGLQMSLKFQIG